MREGKNMVIVPREKTKRLTGIVFILCIFYFMYCDNKCTFVINIITYIYIIYYIYIILYNNVLI